LWDLDAGGQDRSGRSAEAHQEEDPMSGPEDTVGGETKAPVSRFRISRAEQARDMDEHSMPAENITATDLAGSPRPAPPAPRRAAMARLLFADPVSRMSVGYGWFRANYMLPRHSHNADCADYVISGEAHLGTEVLRAGDGFFIPSGHNYQYSAGPEGVEVLEFRNADHFNIRLSGNGEAVWERIAAMALANRDYWRGQTPPPAAARMG
jgi:hypothetical protein